MRRPQSIKLPATIAPLYLSQFATFVVPVATIPFLTRTLTLPAWGQLAFMQSCAGFLSIFIEYGFAFSGTRQVAETRHHPVLLSRVLSGVQGAKLLLALCAVAACCLFGGFIPLLSSSPRLFWAGMLWAVGQALNLNWFFLGLERISKVTAIDLSLKLVAASAMFVIVHGPGDAWKVLALQAAALLLSAAICWGVAAWRLPVSWPSPSSVGEALRQGRAAMLFRVAESSYTAGGPMFLGLFCDASAVGLYAGAEKICRGVMLSLLEPLQRSLYASVTTRIQISRAAAGVLVRKAAIWTALLATGMSLAVFVLAPYIVRVALGASFLPCTGVLRILCLLPPAVALKWSIGIHWMMPGGLGRQFAQVVAGSCLLYIGLGVWLAGTAGAVGMAVTAAVVELAIPLACLISTQRAGMNLFAGSPGFPDLVNGTSTVSSVP